MTKKIPMRLVTPIATPTGVKNTVLVYRTEEKGSDVNLATHLVHDGHRGLFDVAVLITNDSDILEAIKIVRDELHYDVGILNPHTAQPSVELRRHASFMHPIRKGVLAASQFPHTLTDAVGQFHKPVSW